MTLMEELQLTLKNEGDLYRELGWVAKKEAFTAQSRGVAYRSLIRKYANPITRKKDNTTISLPMAHALQLYLCKEWGLPTGEPPSGTPSEAPARAGRLWTGEETRALVDGFKSGVKISDLAAAHARTAGAILGRLVHEGMLIYKTDESAYYTQSGWCICRRGQLQAQPEPQPMKETKTMSHIDQTKSVDRATFIYGTDSRDVSDDAIFNHIAKLEAQIKELNDIKSKPKKLVAKIEALQADIVALTELVDGR